MKICSTEQFHSIEKALKGVGFKVDTIIQEGNKTVITVFQYDTQKKISPRKIKDE